MPIRNARSERPTTADKVDTTAENVLLEKLLELAWTRARSHGTAYVEFLRTEGLAIEAFVTSTATLAEPVDVKFLLSALRILANRRAPARTAVLTRGLEALEEIEAQLDENQIAGILANSSDRDILIDLLEQAPPSDIDSGNDALRNARLRGNQMREQILLAEGGYLSAEQVGKHLHITRQAVDRRRSKGQLLALPIGAKAYAYPQWQFDESGVLPGFVETLASFTLPGPWTRAAFLLSPNRLLNGARPLDELRNGNVADVKKAAASYGDQSAA